MFHLPLATSSSQISLEKFWNAVLLYHDRPHLINRRLIGVATIFFFEVDFDNKSIKRLAELFTRPALLYEIRKLKEISKEYIAPGLIEGILKPYDKEVRLIETTTEAFMKSLNDEGVYVSVRILYPRHTCYERCLEIVVLDKKSKIATFLAVTEFEKKALAPVFPYDIHHDGNGNLRICVDGFDNAEDVSAGWLTDELFPKLIKWAENYDGNCEIQQSLSLVSVEKYTELYHNLKIKYGERLVKIWPEKTDPLKYVYEDIAIATYLILLWERTNPNGKPTFVDLGCGNGLLVHLLNEEGYPGFGIDVRKRKVWDLYPDTTSLKIQTITPSETSLFPQADWIIGNHSDELTPWIPVIAARSSQKTNFFLLPCCCYEFNGQKYKRLNSSISIYTEYLEYVRDIAKKCNFTTKVDKLRIPSTRRTCIVSFGKFNTPDLANNISDLIKERCGKEECLEDNSSGRSVWTNNFQARSNIEKVRNCTKLNKNLILSFIDEITKLLLTRENLIKKPSGEMWNRGGSISLPDLAEALSKSSLKELKNECGGLQTLLKNHRYIFEVTKGFVQLRIPSTLEDTKSKYTSKPCWFCNNHPGGCFRDDETCAYRHC